MAVIPSPPSSPQNMPAVTTSNGHVQNAVVTPNVPFKSVIPSIQVTAIGGSSAGQNSYPIG